jgi:N-acetylmuramoyl-L-alanine amidase
MRYTIKVRIYVLVITILMSNHSIANESLLAIDAGHSKSQSGATSAFGKSEFEFNTVLASTISNFMSLHGISVIKIGHDGNITNLKERTLIANNANAKLFLSIHHDSVQPQFLKDWQLNGRTRKHSDYASGFSLFVSRKNSYLTESLQCAIAIGTALKEKGLHSSPHHAESIPGENREWANKESGVYYYDDLIVLKTAKMPAILLEAGVIVNREEEQTIQTTEMRNIIAEAVENGLFKCKIIE